MEWIDLHCDTPLELFRKQQSLRQNRLHIDLEKTASFSSFIQCSALYCPANIPDEQGYGHIREMAAYFLSEIEKNSGTAMLIREKRDLRVALEGGKRGFLLTLEDARILNNDLSRLRVLKNLGVRIVTPLWRGVSSIGGAHDTNIGLSGFGENAVTEMLSLGLLPDVSHASVAAFREIEKISRKAGKPLLATHSNAFSLCRHSRNLTDEQIRSIGESGGVIGINLFPSFLSATGKADLSDVLRQIRHLFRIGGKDTVAWGSDFDGIDCLPIGISHIASMAALPEFMHKSGFSTEEIECLFQKNAARILNLILD